MASQEGKELLKGCLLSIEKKSPGKLTKAQTAKLERLLAENTNMNTLYVLKEQLQALWSNTQVEIMAEQLDQWCDLAGQADMTYIRSLAELLRKHKTGNL
jgi:transposase